jgi:hypothetical protein
MKERASWIDTFCQLLSSPRGEDHEAAIALKSANYPEHLYKFFSPNDYALDALRRRSVWLARASTFNDLYDTTLTVDVGAAVEPSMRVHIHKIFRTSLPGLLSDAELDAIATAPSPLRVAITFLAKRYAPHDPDGLEAILERIPEVLHGGAARPQAAKFSSLIQNRLRAACFSEDVSSMKMWGHYAESHTGFCVQFCPSELAPRIEERAILLPVRYIADRFDFTEQMTRFAESGATAMTPLIPVLAAIHKSTSWSEEREWRIVKDGGDDGPGEILPVRGALAVYLGARISPDMRDRVCDIAGAAGHAIYGAVMSDDGFELRFVPCR